MIKIDLLALLCLFNHLGPEHGLCGCDKRCKCREGWTGDDCSCTTKTDGCLVNNVIANLLLAFSTHFSFIRLFVTIKVFVNVADANVTKIRVILGPLVKIVL